MLVLECNNCFSWNLKKYAVVESYNYYNETYQCCRCGNLMDIKQVIISKAEDPMELSSEYWVSKDGKKHEFKDMSADYLKNCIELLKRTYSTDELKDSNLFTGLTQEYMLR